MGAHVSMDCAGSEEEWQLALEATKAAKARGCKVKVVLHDALSADIWDLSLAAANLCDAGADILTVEALGGDVDEDAVRELIEACCENDILGVPMMMRLGVRFGPLARPPSHGGAGNDDGAANEDETARATQRMQALVASAAEMGIYHFDACPLGLRALTPSALGEALAEAGVATRLAVR
jgi:hypothetical protein